MDVRSSSYSATAKRYAEQVVAGEILAYRWVQRACQRQLDDLAKFAGNGTRRFRRSYIEVPRGNAKSTLSSAVALYMLAADREGGAEV
jgi:phage terminase large subunit-like protein